MIIDKKKVQDKYLEIKTQQPLAYPITICKHMAVELNYSWNRIYSIVKEMLDAQKNEQNR